MILRHAVLSLTSLLMVVAAAGAQTASPDWANIAPRAEKALSSALTALREAGPSSRQARAAKKELAESRALYDQLIAAAPVDDSELARLLHNRALAELHSGDAPSALFDLARANYLRPGVLLTERTLTEARHAVEAGPDAAPPAPTPVSVGDQARSLAWTAVRAIKPQWRLDAVIAAGGAFWCFVGAMVLTSGKPSTQSRRIRRAAIIGSLFCGAIAALATLITGFEHFAAPPANHAVVLAPDCRVFAEPGEPPADSKPAVGETLKRGAELIVLDSSNLLAEANTPPAWLKVRSLVNGASAGEARWVRAIDVGLVNNRS